MEPKIFKSENFIFYTIDSQKGKLLAQINLETSIAKINSIEIKPRFKGQGVGSAPVKSFEDFALKEQCAVIQIDAYKKSLGFWIKNGYALSDDFPILDGDKQHFKPGTKHLNSPQPNTQVIASFLLKNQDKEILCQPLNLKNHF